MMKYLFCPLLFLLCLSPLTASDLYVSHTAAMPGDTAVSVVVSLDNSKPVAGMEAVLEYDRNFLTLSRIESTPRLASISDFGFYEYSYGKVALVFFDIDGANVAVDSGSIMTVVFDIDPESPDTVAEVYFSEALAVDDIMDYDSITATAGYVRIVGDYVYGDANGDLICNIGDGVYLINYVFKGGPEPSPLEAGDANGDCFVNVADPVYVVNYVFKGGPSPLEGCFAPFNKSSEDPVASIHFELIDNPSQGTTPFYSVQLTSEIDLGGVQIALRSNKLDHSEIHATPEKGAQKMPFVDGYSDTEYTFGFIDIEGKQILPAGEWTIASVSLKDSDDPAMLQTLLSDQIVLADITGRVVNSEVTGLKTDDPLPKTYSLSQNYPNPFNPSTVIKYALPKESDVRLIIFNVLGQTVNILIDGKQEPGEYEIIWDGVDNRGKQVASGIYFYKLIAGDYTNSKKMMLLK